MSKKIAAVASIFALSVIILFVYPSTDKSINAGQSKSALDITAMTNVHRISVSSDDILARYFGKDVVEKIMKQPGCVGVRTYYGNRANGKSGFVIVGVDKNGRDMESVMIAGPTIICPPFCGS